MLFRRKMKRSLYILLAIIIVAFAAIVIVSYADREGRKLQVADSLFDRNLDSARIILESVDTTLLSDSEKAYLHLLRTRYYYYTRNPAWPSSIPDKVLPLLLRENNPDRLQEYYFWHGNSKFSEDLIPEAILDLTKSRYFLSVSSLPVDDKYSLFAHCYSVEARGWCIMGDLNQARALNDSATFMYARANKYMTMNRFTLLDKVAMYEAFSLNQEALRFINSIRRVFKDSEYKMMCDRAALLPLIALGETDSAKKILSGIREDTALYNSGRIRYAKALLAFHDKDYEKAKQELNVSRSYVNWRYGDYFNPIRYIKLEKDIATATGNYAEAMKKQDSISMYYQQRDLNSGLYSTRRSIETFHNQIRETAEKDARTARIITILVGTICFSVLLILFLIGWTLYKKHREKTEKLLNELDDLKIKDEIHRQNIQSLVGSHFNTLNRLCDDYIELSDLKDKTALKNEILKNLNAQIAEIRSDKFRKNLEDSVNTDLEGLFTRFKTLDNVSKEDEILFLYSAAGFSVKAIGVFLDLKKSSVYTRRRRLREKIEQSDSPYKEELLRFI